MAGFLILALIFSVGYNVRTCVGQVHHHVVGGDRGWEPSSDIEAWSSAKKFRVGDKIWFAYSAALESIVEVSTIQEFHSCDTSNPVRLYMDGIDEVTLKDERPRYFISRSQQNCKRGLKLRVNALPMQETNEQDTSAVLDEPKMVRDVAKGPTPSGWGQQGPPPMLWIGLVLIGVIMGFQGAL